MARVKRGTIHSKRRARILRLTKGFRGRRKSHLREARQALIKAGQYALRDRRKKKSVFRALWHVQLSAALRGYGISYSKFMHHMHTQNIAVNRKMLTQLANKQPETFRKLVQEVRST